jgi:hypothetical protein
MRRVRTEGFFEVGSHALRISEVKERLDRQRAGVRGSPAPVTTRRWAVTVDRVPVDRLFSSRPDAWTAGVIEADRIDRFVARVECDEANPGPAPALA